MTAGQNCGYGIFKDQKTNFNLYNNEISINTLLLQVESQGLVSQPTIPKKDVGGFLKTHWSDILDTQSSEKMQKDIESNIDQIVGVSYSRKK